MRDVGTERPRDREDDAPADRDHRRSYQKTDEEAPRGMELRDRVAGEGKRPRDEQDGK
jgi:hypothetical protein